MNGCDKSFRASKSFERPEDELTANVIKRIQALTLDEYQDETSVTARYAHARAQIPGLAYCGLGGCAARGDNT